MGVGIRYERKAQEYLCGEFGYQYIPGPWIEYRVRDRPKVVNYAQPDGLLIQPRRGTVTIVEVKYNHISDSYFQLVDKYLPLVMAIFDKSLWTFPLVTVVKWFDPHTSYPVSTRLVDDIEKCDTREIGVHIYNPGRR